MEQFFGYSRPVTGKDLIGRKGDINFLQNLLGAGENVALYGEPKDGRHSIVQHVLTTVIPKTGKMLVEIDLMRCRTSEDFLLRYASSVMKCCGTTITDYREMMSLYLSASHIYFDPDSFGEESGFLYTNEILDKASADAILSFPFRLAADRGFDMILYFDQFQAVSATSLSYDILRILEGLLSDPARRCSAVFIGGMLNAMKDIFEVKRFLWKEVSLFQLSKVAMTDIIDYVRKGFQMRGKVIENAEIANPTEILRSNMWYVNHLFSIIDRAMLGYVSERSVAEGMQNLMSIHSRRFFAQVTDLTDFQLSMLHAVIDGEVKFSTSAVIEKYRLNSSANVKRLKDALMKKEVLWFDDNDVPHIQDPLFELWLRQEYFGKTGK